MDEVAELGNYFVVRYREKLDILHLRDITEIEISTIYAPTRVTLSLCSLGKFGGEIAFLSASEGSENWEFAYPLIQQFGERVSRKNR